MSEICTHDFGRTKAKIPNNVCSFRTNRPSEFVSESWADHRIERHDPALLSLIRGLRAARATSEQQAEWLDGAAVTTTGKRLQRAG